MFGGGALPKDRSISKDQRLCFFSLVAVAASFADSAMALSSDAPANVVADSAATASAPNPPIQEGAPLKRARPDRKLRKKAGHIDLDDRILLAKQRAATAMLLVKQARNEARNEKKRRTRLLRKAGALTDLDLERIAKLKRAGLWDPDLAPVVLATVPNKASCESAPVAGPSGSTEPGGSIPDPGAAPAGETDASSGTESPAAEAAGDPVDEMMGAGIDDL